MHGESCVVQSARKGRTEVSAKHLNSEELTTIRQAKQTEVQNWVRNAVVEAASKKGIPTRNLMRLRWVLTKTSEGRFKACIVVQGFTDPHLAHLRLAMHVHKRDVTAAFLQGDTELERGVLAEPVQEVAETLKLQPWECVRLRKPVGGRRSIRSWLTSAGSLSLWNLVFGSS